MTLLTGRIAKNDKRYATFKRLFELLNARGAKVLVETGTARHGKDNFKGDGGSTILFADWASQNNALLYSIDIDRKNIEAAREATLSYKNALKLICQDSLDFLLHFSESIDFLYLDSMDFTEDRAYDSQIHHLFEIEMAYDRLSPQSIVMIDDCRLKDGGKGKYVIEFLENRGWKKTADEYQVILIS